MRGSSTRKSVVEEVVGRGLCVGCGVCAAVCPKSCLEMAFNNFGEYEPNLPPNPLPTREGEQVLPSPPRGGAGGEVLPSPPRGGAGGEVACNGCGLCLKVCPFADGNPNEDDLGDESGGRGSCRAFAADCGHYMTSYIGHSLVRNHRSNGASGGLATWVLETLLASGTVDAVIAARPNPDPDKLFNFAVIDDANVLRECSRSCYYPLEISAVLKHVLTNDARCAVIGLPCVIKALRLAEKINPKLASRLIFHAGLVCGQLKSKFFAEYITKLAGGDPRSVRRIAFREKRDGLPGRDPLFTYRTTFESAEPDGCVRWSEGYGEAWDRGYFKINACNYCDDIFAELADASFMDAWLPEYESDPCGTSLVIVRNAAAADIMKDGRERGELFLEEIPIKRVIESQSPVINSKRNDLAARLWLADGDGRSHPRKRVLPARKISPETAARLRLAERVRQRSRTAWVQSGGDIKSFEKEMETVRVARRTRAALLLRRGARRAKRMLLGSR